MSTVVVGTIQSNSTSPPTFNNTNGTEIGTLCRAFCNFNGTSTVAIRASFNVSSITDNGTGDYTVNLATAMPDADYAWAVSAGRTANSVNFSAMSQASPTTSALRFQTTDAAFNLVDMTFATTAIFR